MIDLLDSQLEVQSIDAHTWVISQGQGRGRTHSYLLEGKKKAALIDTGLGLINIKEITDSLTKKDVFVINTHGHLDHISNNDQYEHVYLHPNDNAIYREHSEEEFRREYFTKRYIEKGMTMEVLQQSPYKERLEVQICLPEKSYEPLYEGMCMELGERKLQIIATPGHTPGSICVLDKTYRYLFSGDSICEAGVLLNFPYSSSIATYLHSLLTLKEYTSMFEVIYAGHQTIPLDPVWIDDFIGCTKAILKEEQSQEDGVETHMVFQRAAIDYRTHRKEQEEMKEFTYEYIRKNVIRICDSMQVAMYLVIGEERACLLDSGVGIGNLAEFVKTLTDKPIFLILTHGHFDHAGGAAQFDEVYLHPQDRNVYQEHNSITFRKEMLNVFTGQEMPIEDVLRTQPFNPLEDEQVFDLGGISIKMIQVCGHTQGMMMALIPEDRMILFGDACGVNVMLYEDWAADVSTYKESLEHVRDTYASSYDYVIRNHGTYTSPCHILDELIACCEDVLSHKDNHIPTDIFGMQGFYRAKAVDDQGNRIDGKVGNLVYRFDKVK